MSDSWSCIMASEKYSKKDCIQIVINNIKKILGNDVNIFYVDNKNEKSFDGYFFVQKDITDCSYEFKNNIYFQNVLSSFEKVTLIPNSEILKMKESVTKKHDKFFKYGDIILVKRGIYENLRGICVGVKDKSCEIGFKFCTGCFVVDIEKNDIVCEDNIFNYIRKPFYVHKRH